MGDLLRRREMMQEAAAPPASNLLYNWDLKSSMADTVNGIVAISNGTTDSDGVYINTDQRYLRLPGTYDRDRTIWATFADFSIRKGGTVAKNGRVLCASNGTNTSSGGAGLIYRQNNGTINFYTGSWNTESVSSSGKYEYFANSIFKMYVDADGIAKVYKNSDLFLTSTGSFSSTLNGKDYVFGGSSNDCAAYIRITAVQIYDGFVI